MEMSIFEKDGKTYTRFKITLKESKLKFLRGLLTKYDIDTSEPVKKNSRYIYFEKEGDWINGKIFAVRNKAVVTTVATRWTATNMQRSAKIISRRMNHD